MLEGGCHCGEVRFRMPNRAVASSLCHCRDCRKQSGAPASAWAMARVDAVAIVGEPKVYASSPGGRRSFCGSCGTGLFFRNATLDGMGMVQVRIAALDDPDAIRPEVQVQLAETIGWMSGVDALPGFDRFPG